jgi:hypothetical protein
MSSGGGQRLAYRSVLLGVAAVALVTAVLSGLSRIGWNTWGRTAEYAHGPTLVLGFLGTVIGMERAVALGRRWAWLVPVLAASAVTAGIVGLSAEANALIFLAGVGLVAVFVVAYRIQQDLHLWIMGGGALCWVLAGVGLLLGTSLVAVVPSLAGFLVLTIVGERFELTRLLEPTGVVRAWLVAASGLAIVGAGLSLADVGLGARVVGLGMAACGLWLGRYDVARRTIRMAGITRYMAAALIAGYFWLLLAGAIWTWAGLDRGTFIYDATLHAVFLGFVFSMVFAHAPVIVPALTGLRFPFTHWLWVPLATLHMSLLLRVLSDFGGWQIGRMWGGCSTGPPWPSLRSWRCTRL